VQGGRQQSTGLDPVEGLWSSLKGMEPANLTSPSLAEVVDQAYRGIDRVGRTPHLAYSFLRHAGLSVGRMTFQPDPKSPVVWLRVMSAGPRRCAIPRARL
jgi:hypothetical protein